MAYTFGYTGGNVDVATVISKADSFELGKGEKHGIAAITLTAASKTVTAGLGEGQYMYILNAGGTNAFTLKNVAGDTGTSIAAGKFAVIIGSKTADASIVKVLN